MRNEAMGALFKEMMDSIGSTMRDLRAYLLGRGIVTTLAITAGFMGSGIFGAAASAALAPAVSVALIGGVVLSGVMRLREMRYNQDRMADIYREDIADQLGIAPEQVTREHVHTLAFGDVRRGIAPNPILREEIDREWNKTWLKFATSALAAMASFGLIQFGLAHEFVASKLPALLGTTAGAIVGAGSVGIVTGFTGLFLNNGLDFAIQRSTTLGDVTMHDRIKKLDRDITRGRAVSAEQVFSLFVAADRMLDSSIARRFGKPYDLLSIQQKATVLEQLGAADAMQSIASDLNSKRIGAGSIAFIITGQQGTPLHGATVAPVTASLAHAPVQEQQPRYVERVAGPRGNEGLSHTEREDLRRAAAQLETVTR